MLIYYVGNPHVAGLWVLNRAGKEFPPHIDIRQGVFLHLPQKCLVLAASKAGELTETRGSCLHGLASLFSQTCLHICGQKLYPVLKLWEGSEGCLPSSVAEGMGSSLDPSATLLTTFVPTGSCTLASLFYLWKVQLLSFAAG